jgi:uncharacterized protein (TIGR02300 family)
MAELGNKFECAECGTKFYDLGNANAVCPKCGTAPRRNGNEIERRVPLARLPETTDADEEPDVVVVEEEGVEEVAEELEEGVVDAGEEE